MTTQRIHDRIHVLLGYGGNVAAVSGGDGVLMVDSGLAESADALLAAVGAATPGPVKTLFTTHWHPDHVGANPQLGRAGARILGHVNCLKRLSETVVAEPFNRIFAPLPVEGRPSVTFTEGGEIATGAGMMRYVHVPVAHTDGDAFVFFPEANVLHAGDLFWNRQYPKADYSTGGWLGGMVAAHEVLMQHCDAKTVVIPGHGEVGRRTDLAYAHDVLTTIAGRIEELRLQGKTEEEVVAARPSREFDAEWGGGMLEPDRFVRLAFRSHVRRSQAAGMRWEAPAPVGR